jgi:phospholipase C
MLWGLAFAGLLVETSPACGNGIGSPDSARSTSQPLVGPHPLPIKHVVVVVKENHTFDNYFGTFPGAEGTTKCLTTKGAVAASRAPNVTPRDLDHGHGAALTDWNRGELNGWLAVPGASDDGDNLFCAQYLEEDLPGYWAYARAYGLADHFFANVLGPSFPGHAFLIAAQAAWALDNPFGTPEFPYWGCDEAAKYGVEILERGSCSASVVRPCFDIPSVPTLLPRGVDWRFYGTTFGDHAEVWSMFDAIRPIRETALWNNVVNASAFDHDVEAGTLPAVTWLVDEDGDDEHPGAAGVCEGENWTSAHLNPLMQSPLWDSTVVFFTMDDFGGWYDHVPPPRQYGCSATQPYGLGFRLPLIVMSPYVKRGVYKGVAEQASIVKFILEAFGATGHLSDLDPAAQDGQANDLMDMFDWSQKPLDPLVVPPRACSLSPSE